MANQLNKQLLKNISENNFEKVQKYCETFDPKIDDEYVILAAQLGHVDCVKILVEKDWHGVWSGSGLDAAVKFNQNDCIQILLEKTSTNGKYNAFKTALIHNNEFFLEIFVPTIPSFSINWVSVFGALVEHDRLDLAETCLEICNWNKVMQLVKNEEDVQVIRAIDEVNNYRLKKKIAANIDHSMARAPIIRKI